MDKLEWCSPSLVYSNHSQQALECPEPFIFDPYWNRCTKASAVQLPEEDNSDVITALYGFVLPVLAAFVIISNGVVIVVLCYQRSVIAQLLIAIAFEVILS